MAEYVLKCNCCIFATGSRQFSTLIIAGGAAVAASLGGLLLDDGVKLGEEAVENGGIPGVNLATAPIDDNTRLLLQIGAGLLILVGATIGELVHHRHIWGDHARLA